MEALARLAVLVGSETLMRVCNRGGIAFPSSARREAMLLRAFCRGGDMLVRGQGADQPHQDAVAGASYMYMISQRYDRLFACLTDALSAFIVSPADDMCTEQLDVVT